MLPPIYTSNSLCLKNNNFEYYHKEQYYPAEFQLFIDINIPIPLQENGAL
jgi:hypothetical protein